MDKAYLEEGFDPTSLKVPQLRGVLNENNVLYASNAKKAELVELFEKNIAPKAPALLNAHKEKAAGGDGTGFENISGGDLEAPEPKKKRGRPKKSDASVETTPVVPQKRAKEELGSGEKKKKKKMSLPASAPSSAAKKSRGHLFDENLSFSDDDFFATKIKRSPARSKQVAKDETGAKETELTPLKRRAKLKSPLSSAKKEEVFVPQFRTLKEEEDSFEATRLAAKNKKLADMAADLGVTVHGEAPRDFKLDASSFASETNEEKGKGLEAKATPRKSERAESVVVEKTPSKTPKKTPKRTPKKTQKTLKEELNDDEPQPAEKAAKTPARVTPRGSKTNTPVKLARSTPAKTAQAAAKENGSKRTPRRTPRKAKAPSPREKPTAKEEDVGSDDLDAEDDAGETTDLSTGAPTAGRPSASRPFFLFFFILLWLLAVVGGVSVFWYREQQYLVGFCGQEIEQSTVPATAHPVLVAAGAYLDAHFKPNCTPCPPHARCYPYLELGCYEDFVESQPWYFRLTPTLHTSQKRCIPDTKKAEKLEIMIDVALDLLRSRNADKNCGGSPDHLDAGLNTTELHDLLLMMKAPYITRVEFEELWERLVVELEKEPEVIVRQVETEKRYLWKSKKLNGRGE